MVMILAALKATGSIQDQDRGAVCAEVELHALEEGRLPNLLAPRPQLMCWRLNDGKRVVLSLLRGLERVSVAKLS